MTQLNLWPPKLWYIHFQMKVNKKSSTGRSVFRFSALGTSTHHQIGNRMPLIYIHPNTLRMLIKSIVDSNTNSEIGQFYFPKNEYFDILIQQALIDGLYYIEVLRDGTLMKRTVNTNFQTFKANIIFSGYTGVDNEIYIKEFDYGTN